MAVALGACGGGGKSDGGGQAGAPSGGGTAGAGGAAGASGSAGAAGSGGAAMGGAAGSAGAGGGVTVPPIDFDAPYDVATVIVTSPSARQASTTHQPEIVFAGSSGREELLQSISWELSTGGGGTLPPGPTWETGTLTLEAGDNVFTVRAEDGSPDPFVDSIVVTYDPDVEFTSPFSVLPAGGFTGEPTTVEFRIEVAGSPNAVEVVRVDASGAVVETVVALSDDGSGFAGSTQLTESAPAEIDWRVRVTMGSETALSETFRFRVFDRMTAAEIDRAIEIVDLASDQFIQVESTAGFREAVLTTARWLADQPELVELDIQPFGHYISWKLESGIEQMLNVAPAGIKGGGPHIGSTVGLLLESFHDEWFSPDPTENASLIPLLPPIVNAQTCPRLAMVSHPAVPLGPSAVVEDYKALPDKGMVVLSTHGGITGRGAKRTEAIKVDELVDAASYIRNHLDMLLGRMFPVGRLLHSANVQPGQPQKISAWALKPAFFRAYSQGMKDSIVVGAFCHSDATGKMAKAFLAGGARSYLGYSSSATAGYIDRTTLTFFQTLMDGANVLDSHAAAANSWGAHEAGSFWQLKDRILARRGEIEAAGFCQGRVVCVDEYTGPDGSVRTVDFQSMDEIAFVPSSGTYVLVSRQASCDWYQEQPSLGSGVDGDGQIDEVYLLGDSPPERIAGFGAPLLPPLINWDPDSPEGDWVRFTPFGSPAPPYDGRCSCPPGNPILDPAEIQTDGIRGSRSIPNGGVLPTNQTLWTFEYTFPDTFQP